MYKNIKIKKSIYFNSNMRRNTGKTTIINELGLTLQSLGYEVYILTLSNCVEYNASKRICRIDDLDGIKTDSLVILIDEEFRESNLFLEVENFCDDNSVSMVGFVIYK